MPAATAKAAKAAPKAKKNRSIFILLEGILLASYIEIIA
jgi:hypothetical protein